MTSVSGAFYDIVAVAACSMKRLSAAHLRVKACKRRQRYRSVQGRPHAQATRDARCGQKNREVVKAQVDSRVVLGAHQGIISSSAPASCQHGSTGTASERRPRPCRCSRARCATRPATAPTRMDARRHGPCCVAAACGPGRALATRAPALICLAICRARAEESRDRDAPGASHARCLCGGGGLHVRVVLASRGRALACTDQSIDSFARSSADDGPCPPAAFTHACCRRARRGRRQSAPFPLNSTRSETFARKSQHGLSRAWSGRRTGPTLQTTVAGSACPQPQRAGRRGARPHASVRARRPATEIVCPRPKGHAS